MGTERALICGIGGQDGAYLARLLLSRGYRVYGTTRAAPGAPLPNLQALGLSDRVELLTVPSGDADRMAAAVAHSDPGEIYWLSGQSSVGLSFEQPVATVESQLGGMLDLLETLRRTRSGARLFHASSAECFGDHGAQALTADCAFRPGNPYAVAKAAAHWLVCSYRSAYGLYAVNGILFNHESPLRPARFVTRKIVAAAARIAAGSDELLQLGRLDVVRDWGWAPEFVEAMWRMLQRPQPQDLVLATGHAYRLQDFVAEAFAALDLDWRAYVQLDPALFRASDTAWSQGDPRQARAFLDWEAQWRMPEVVRGLLAAERGAPP